MSGGESHVIVERYGEPAALLRGLKALRQRGVTPRGLLFLALSPDGAIHVGIPANLEHVTSMKFGEKLALMWPLEGRFFHFDAIHRLPGSFVLWNGDRRLKDPGDATEVAAIVASFLKGGGARDVLFGCTPHQSGSWMAEGRTVAALHEQGHVEVVPVAQGLFARRVMDHRLFYLSFSVLAATGRLDGWVPVYESTLGNLLLLERRVLNDRLVLSCERGLVEVDVSQVPRVVATSYAQTNGSMAVVGRIDGGAFSVTSGKPQPWGLDELRPALLVGGQGGTLADLGRALAAADGQAKSS
jgi:hypothetical protein